MSSSKWCSTHLKPPLALHWLICKNSSFWKINIWKVHFFFRTMCDCVHLCVCVAGFSGIPRLISFLSITQLLQTWKTALKIWRFGLQNKVWMVMMIKDLSSEWNKNIHRKLSNCSVRDFSLRNPTIVSVRMQFSHLRQPTSPNLLLSILNVHCCSVSCVNEKCPCSCTNITFTHTCFMIYFMKFLFNLFKDV